MAGNRIGYGAGADIRVDVDRLLASRMLIQSNSGGGKSHALRQLLEETHGLVQHLVLDPEGEFATLRERFGYVLAAKTGGDVAATPKVARVLCRKLVELGASAVLDLYDLTLAERREFVRIFLEELMALPRELWRPILVVIDEAHLFVPERGSGEAQSTDAVIALCTQGRKRGFCAVLATQRISKLHKDAAAELLNKLIGRTGLDIDVRRAGDELGFGKEERAALKSLAPGEFFAYGPAIRPAVTRVRTADVVTKHPQPGRTAAVPAPPQSIQGLLQQLGDLPQQAEQEARTIADLQREVQQLRAAARTKTPVQVSIDPGHVQRQVDAAVKAAKAEMAAAAKARESQEREEARRRDGLRRQLTRAHQQLREIAEAVEGAAVALAPLAILERPTTESPPRPIAPAVDWAKPGGDRSVAVGIPGDLTGPQQRILNAVAWLDALGIAAPLQVAVAFLAGYTAGAGAFNNTKAQLRALGLIEYAGDGFRLTDTGRLVAHIAPTPLTTDELHRRVLDKLDGPGRRVLAPLLEAWPEACTKDAVAEQANYTAGAGAFNNACGRLRSLGLVDYPSPGSIRAADLLFLESR